MDECFVYQPEIKKLTKSNSVMIDDRIVYIVKKEHNGKSTKLFIAYDYETKIQLSFSLYKESLIEYLKKKGLGVLNERTKV